LLLRSVLRALVSVEGLRRGGGESSAVVCGWRVEEGYWLSAPWEEAGPGGHVKIVD
jgi:hypothetical protein